MDAARFAKEMVRTETWLDAIAGELHRRHIAPLQITSLSDSIQMNQSPMVVSAWNMKLVKIVFLPLISTLNLEWWKNNNHYCGVFQPAEESSRRRISSEVRTILGAIPRTEIVFILSLNQWGRQSGWTLLILILKIQWGIAACSIFSRYLLSFKYRFAQIIASSMSWCESNVD